MPKFSFEFVGAFYTSTLYDDMGREVTELYAAAETAERMYGEDWSSVFNGNEGITRDEYIAWRDAEPVRAKFC